MTLKVHRAVYVRTDILLLISADSWYDSFIRKWGEAEEKGGKRMYEMKDEYLTGIELIDNEHKVLFQIADEIYQLCTNEFVPDKYDHISNLIQRLKDYAIMHFEHEEEYMEGIRYKRMFTQKIQHDNFKRKLDTMDLEIIDDDQEQAIQELLKFVTDWLVEHILETDKRIGH